MDSDSDGDTDETNYLLGLGAVICAILSFGSFGVPLRGKEFVKTKVNPIVLQCYFSAAVYLTSFVSFIFVSWEFSWWGWLGAACWVVTSLMSFVAIGQIGIAIPQAVWSGTTIIVSFLWGALVFHEKISFYLSIPGAFLLVLGVGGVSVSNLQIETKFEGCLEVLYNLPVFVKPPEPLVKKGDIRKGPPLIDSDFSSEPLFGKSVLNVMSDDSSNVQVGRVEKNFKESEEEEEEGGGQKFTSRNWAIGLTLSILMGIPNGSMMVPTEIDGVPQGINYLMSFSTGVLVCTAFVALCYILFTAITQRKMIEWKIVNTLIPGFSAGLLFSSGNFFTIYATKYLGLTIGFPLTQVAMVVSGLWGLFYFKETTRTSAIICFFCSTGVILIGATLLALGGRED